MNSFWRSRLLGVRDEPSKVPPSRACVQAQFIDSEGAPTCRPTDVTLPGARPDLALGAPATKSVPGFKPGAEIGDATVTIGASTANYAVSWTSVDEVR